MAKQERYNKKKGLPTTGEKGQVKHEFTAEEWKTLASEHIALLRRVASEEDARQAANEVAKARIKELNAQAMDMANKLQQGYELRTVDLLVEFDRKAALKRYYRFAPEDKEVDGLFVEVKQMTEDDFQLLPLGDVKGGKPAKKADAAPEPPAAADGEKSPGEGDQPQP